MNSNKVALVTGCSSGIGLDLVSALLLRDWTVIATARSLEKRPDLLKAERAKFPARLLVEQLDVNSLEDSRRVSDLIGTRFGGRLDLLVNNAGYGQFGALEDLSEDEVRVQMETNFFGLVRVTQNVLPHLRAAHGRIINLSSVLGFSGLPLASLYCASKHAVEGLSECLYYELKPLGVQVCLVEPGGHKTEFGANLSWGKRSFAEDSPYTPATQAFSDYMSKLRSAEESASGKNVVDAIVRALEKKTLPLRLRVGSDAFAAYLAKRLLPQRILFPIAAALMPRVLGMNRARAR